MRRRAAIRDPHLPLPWRSWPPWRSWRPSGSRHTCASSCQRAHRFNSAQAITSATSDAARDATAIASAGALPTAGAKLIDRIASRTPTPAGAASATKPPTVASAYRPDVESARPGAAPNARDNKKPCTAQLAQYKTCANSSANGTSGPAPSTLSTRTTNPGSRARSMHESTITMAVNPSTIGIAHAPRMAMSPLLGGDHHSDAKPTPPPTAVHESISRPTDDPTETADTPNRPAPAMRTKGKPTMPGV